MDIKIKHLKFEPLEDDCYLVSGLILTPDAPAFSFLGKVNDEFVFVREDDLQLLYNQKSNFYYHRMDDVKRAIKRSVFLRRTATRVGVNEIKEA